MRLEPQSALNQEAMGGGQSGRGGCDEKEDRVWGGERNGGKGSGVWELERELDTVVLFHKDELKAEKKI